MKIKTTVYLVRHGETEWNEKRLIQGHMDIPLNEKGKLQARGLVDRLGDVKFEALFSSDLSRAYDTAAMFAEKHGLEVHRSFELRERNFGKFQGRSFGKEKNIGKLINKLKLEHGGVEIETDTELMKRFVPKLREIVSGNPERTVLVVTHGGTIRTFLVMLGWGTYENLTEGSIDNLAYVKLASDGDKFSVVETSGISRIP